MATAQFMKQCIYRYFYRINKFLSKLSSYKGSCIYFQCSIPKTDLTYKYEHVVLCYRFSCVPVDFEVVNVNSSLTNEDDINNAITAICRNGVALKG